MTWWQPLVAVLAGWLLLYAVLLLMMWRYAKQHPEALTAKGALRILPDVLRLIRRLATDRTLPATIRLRLLVLLVYLVMPIDIVPDFIPVIGYADDAVIVALALRSVIKGAGEYALGKHWPGTEEGFRLVLELAGLGKRGG